MKRQYLSIWKPLYEKLKKKLGVKGQSEEVDEYIVECYNTAYANTPFNATIEAFDPLMLSNKLQLAYYGSDLYCFGIMLNDLGNCNSLITVGRLTLSDELLIGYVKKNFQMDFGLVGDESGNPLPISGVFAKGGVIEFAGLVNPLSAEYDIKEVDKRLIDDKTKIRLINLADKLIWT